MAKFDAADGALEGFRIVRRRPQVIPAWAGLLLAAGLALGLLGVALGGETLTRFLALQARGGAQAQERALALIGELWPYFLCSLLVNLGVTAVFSAAVFRAVLRPEQGGPGFLRAGADEVRVLASLLGVLAISVGALFGVAVLASLASALLSGSEAGEGLAVLLTIVLLLTLFPYLLVRLSLALPQSFAERRVSVVGGWRLSRRRFWPLFGMMVLAAALSVAVYLLALLVYFPLGALLGGGLRGAVAPMQPTYDSFADWFSPATGAYLLVVVGLAGALINAVLTAPLAYAYKALAAAPEAHPAKPA